MIIAAAIKYEDLVCFVPRPGRHHSVLFELSRVYGHVAKTYDAYDQEVQGFLTDKGEFLDRRQAYEHVFECGQGTPNRRLGPTDYAGTELFSEDLW